MVSFVIGAVLIFLGYGVYGAITAFLAGQLFYCVFLIYLLSSSGKINFKPFDWALAKELLLKSWPYGVLSAIGFASFRIDTVILSYMRGGAETGIYSLAYRFLEAATIIPVAFGTVLYPVFSQHSGNLEKTKQLFRNSLLIGGSAGIIVLLGIVIVVPYFLNYFLPESFSGSSKALMILAIAIPFLFMHIPMSQLLLSKESMLKKILLLYVFVFSINILLMLIIIPVFGYIGAAWVTVIAEASTFLAFLTFIKYKHIA